MVRLGIISPLLPEATCLGLRPRPGTVYSPGKGISVYVSGMGPERATRAAEELALCGMELLISWGTAGALSADLQAGDLIIPEEVINATGQIHKTDLKIRGEFLRRLDECPSNIYLGRLYQAMQAVRGSAEKISLYERYKALAVDMESAAVGAVAARHGLPFLVIRAIIDTPTVPIPQMVLDSTDCFGAVRITSLLLSLCRNPGEIPALIRLAAAFRRSAYSLKWLGARKEQLLRFS